MYHRLENSIIDVIKEEQAKLGYRKETARTICCGDPVIHTDPQCPGSKTSCTFTVTQSLCIQIPIAFGAVIETGEASVQCGEASETPCDCSDEPSVETPVERTQPETREHKFFTR